MPINEPNRPWRSWYGEKEWFRLRRLAIRRDSVEVDGHLVPRCTQTGVLLTGRAPAPDSPVVDHRKPHRGDRNLFFSLANLQTVSKQWHDSVKPRQKCAGLLSYLEAGMSHPSHTAASHINVLARKHYPKRLKPVTKPVSNPAPRQ